MVVTDRLPALLSEIGRNADCFDIQVASVITLGSPFRGISSDPVVLQASKIVQQRIKDRDKRPGRPYCFTQDCDCQGIIGLIESLQASKLRQTLFIAKPMAL